ncbi:MAG: hypothetical protein A2219_03125 [Elusimicrobia bacterium RIFOXYA2_FULL_50_26]|nr:MAG: hypothetical protein A2219_03125 [Elusimicrobia bacterium RIFOXYA2_FULL_50_26]OGS22305.1 MAG: hypothetical protein A2314_01815 [Elusimicrobia bacterium RIFOXYB2_FULL_50_12]
MVLFSCRTKKKLLVACAALLCAAGVGFGDVGKSGWTIFRKIQSAQPKSIAAIMPLQGDLSGVLYNPAVLGGRRKNELFFVSESGLSDDRLGAALYAFPVGAGTLSAGFAYYDAGMMELNWLEGGQLISDTVAAQKDMLGVISYGRRYAGRLALGASVKLASSEIAQRSSAISGAIDAGLIYEVAKNVPVSVAVQNVGIATKFIDKENPLPTGVYFGGGYRKASRNSYMLSGAGVTYNITDATVVPEAGIELGYDFISANLGYRLANSDAALHCGLGVKAGAIEFGYAFSPAAYLNSTHRFNLTCKF